MQLICGLDEAGRGPLAGPVYAACVVLSPDFPVEVLNDSKKLSEKKRLIAEKLIRQKCCFGIAAVDNKKIDEINILQASLLAMKLSYQQMVQKFPQWAQENCISYEKIPDCFYGIADGNKCPELSCSVEAVVKADGKFPAVMAASILAKTERDRVMVEYHKLYPDYGYDRHKGYPTKAHREICRKLGPSPIQRLSFSY